MERYELVIVGGGLASARAIKSYREAGGGGRIALVSADASLPYHRPPLSKRFLRGESEAADALVEQEPFYAEHGVEARLGAEAAGVDTGARAVELATGERLGYGKLLLATGARPRRLDVPGADLPSVFSLRTLADAARLREAARSASRAVVVGAGFIGCEVAASLRHLGLDVTLVHRGAGLFEQLRAPELSAQLTELYRQRGVELVLRDEVAEFRAGSVETRAGRSLPADIAVVGVGVSPSVELLAGSGVELGDGVVVDERYRTSAPDVYAAGDVACFQDPVFGRRRRVEHWSNANYQGAEVGKLLAGAQGGYDVVSSFFTELFGTVLRVFGDTSAFDELVLDGSLDEGRLLGTYLANGRMVGAVLTGQDEETESRLKEAIRAGARPV